MHNSEKSLYKFVNMEPSWDDLRIFLSLARGGTLTTAAKALGVSHPTVARRVQALEKQIGVVRLSAGEAMAAWLARHLPELRKGLTRIEFELTASHTLSPSFAPRSRPF